MATLTPWYCREERSGLDAATGSGWVPLRGEEWRCLHKEWMDAAERRGVDGITGSGWMPQRGVGCCRRGWMNTIERRGVGWGEDVTCGKVQGEDDMPWDVD